MLFKISWNTHELRFSIHMDKKYCRKNVFLSQYRFIFLSQYCSSREKNIIYGFQKQKSVDIFRWDEKRLRILIANKKKTILTIL